MSYRKKLIEVALPLKAINEASAREKSIRHGHPSTLHLWWARRPLAACRAVLFASLVDDPDSDPMYAGAGEDITGAKRAELFNLIEELVQWENSNNPRVINRARAEIARSIAANKVADGEWTNEERVKRSEEREKAAAPASLAPHSSPLTSLTSHSSPLTSITVRDIKNMLAPPEAVNAFLAEHAPPVLDPFCGGGSIPLEAQRLGLRAYASDLNPVPVLITKALIEIPPKFAGLPPVNPGARSEGRGVRSERSEVREVGSERSELREVRSESDALLRDDSLAEGDAGGAGGLSTGSETAARGDVRDAVADHTRGGVDSGECRRGMDARDGQGQGALSGDRAGVAGGGGDPADALRRPGLVSARRHKKPARAARRGQPDADSDATEAEERVKRSEKRVKRSEERDLTSHSSPLTSSSHSSLLFPHSYVGAAGLAEDVRYYGRWMRDEAEKRIGHLYPKVKITPEMAHDRPDLAAYVGQELTVIAWLWARTVKCPNPACGARTPITKTFELSGKKGNEAHLETTIDSKKAQVNFRVSRGANAPRAGNVSRRGADCLLCGAPIPLDHIREEASAERMGQQMMAIVAEGHRNRVYISPIADQTDAAHAASHVDRWSPTTPLPAQALGFRVQRYGMSTHAALFSHRQLVALSTFADLIREIASDAGSGHKPAIATYLAFALSKAANYWSTLCSWYVNKEIMVSTFGLPTLSMVWDFAEANPFSDSSGNWMLGVEQAASAVGSLFSCAVPGEVAQLDARQHPMAGMRPPLISTDPPYYDNIGYANLSDFFYVWLRRCLGGAYPILFSTVLTPKDAELIAEPGRFDNDREEAVKHFEHGASQAFTRLRLGADPRQPMTVFYAFKQQEADDSENGAAQSVISSGWEKMLASLITSGCSVQGTWPIRTEQSGGLREAKRNALASSIVLVCRPRPENAPLATRKDFMNALRAELPEALKNLQRGNIAPVDLAQAAIGPGMAVFTRYAKVVEADGSAMSVRTALGIINQVLDEVLAEQEGDFDPDTRWALAWFAEYGMHDGPFGVAETLSKAKNTAVTGLEEAGVVKARGGKVRLVGREELSDGWDPGADGRLTVWETTQHLIRALETQGESGAAALLARLGGIGETARELAYRLYTLCERKKWADEALAYNGLVIAWPELVKLAHARRQGTPGRQATIFGE